MKDVRTEIMKNTGVWVPEVATELAHSLVTPRL